jgi:hypothetical protein
MRLRRIPESISVALIAILAAGVTGAGADSTSPVTSQVAALKHVGISWATYVGTGNAPRACQLQVQQNVGGVPCDQLPTYFQVLYCPAYPEESSWRDAAEQVVKVKVRGSEGSLVIRASSKKSKGSVKATFSKVGGKWRIASVRSMGQTFTPAGLIFTDGKGIREALWPAHC